MSQEMIDKIRREDINRIIDFMRVHAFTTKEYRDVKNGTGTTSFTVQPYTPTNDNLVTVNVFYREERTQRYKTFNCTFSMLVYFDWHRMKDRRLKIEKIRHEYLAD